MAVVTVPGVGGVTENPIPVTINGSAALSLANQIVAALQAASIGGTLQVAVNLGSSTPIVPGGDVGEVLNFGPSSQTVPAGGYTYAIGANNSPLVLTALPNQNILVGAGGSTVFGAASGNTTVAAGGGNNFINLPTGSVYTVATGDGNDTIWANGSGTIDGGGGADLLTAAPAPVGTSNIIYSAGTGDTIAAGAGNVTVSSSGSDDLVYNGTGSLDLGAAPNSTVVGADTGATTIWGATGDLVFGQNASSVLFISSVGNSASIIGGTNTVTVFGASGADINFVNSVGGGAIISAELGNETLNASLSNSNNTLSGGSGNDSLLSGNGNSVVWLGPSGNDSVQLGTGTDTVNVSSVSGSTRAELIAGFGGSDLFGLLNFGPNAVNNALATATPTVVGGMNSTRITLGDSTTVTFLNVTSLNPSNFGSNTPV